MTLNDELPLELLNTVGFHEGIEQFKQVGAIARTLLQNHAGLQVNSSVLDIGCGIGRIAIPLTDYLSEQAIYRGFDITEGSIDWCTRNISSIHPHFQFERADIFNTAYNTSGKLRPENFVFSYVDKKFDVAIATSVFTHLLSSETTNYLRESYRVLKPGGRLFATFFLLDTIARDCIVQGRSTLNFQYPMDSCMVIDAKTPESAVAYDLEFAKTLFVEHGFNIDFFKFGGWSGRAEEGPDYYQDLVVLKRT